jgi:hypothetical protein
MADFGGMSAADINASMYGGFSPAQGQAVLNNIFGNFGQQTDYYSGLGAAYGRETGGFNGGYDPNGSRGLPDPGLFPNSNYDPSTYAPSAASFAERFAGFGSTPTQAPTPQLPGLISDGGYTLGQPNSPDFRPYLPGQSPSSFDARFGAIDPSGRDMSLPGNQFFDANGNPAVNNPMTQYQNGGFDPFSAQTFAPSVNFGGVGNRQPAAAAAPAAPSGLDFSQMWNPAVMNQAAPQVQNWGASFTSPIGGGAEWPANPWQQSANDSGSRDAIAAALLQQNNTRGGDNTYYGGG